MPEVAPATLSTSAYKSIRPLPQNNPKQAGPNCGLYALSYVMRHWYDKLSGSADAINPSLPARKVDVEGAVKLPQNDPNKQVSLRYIAKHATGTNPLTFLGELFSGEALASVAQRSGFEAKIHKPVSDKYLPTLFKLIDDNHPVVVALDVDQDVRTSWFDDAAYSGPNMGCPGKFGGEHAHWAVVVAYEEGFFSDDVVMFHWERYFQFPATNLRDSSNQLVRFSGQTWFKPKDPAEQISYSDTGARHMMQDKTQPINPLTDKRPLIPARTERGAHWQKLNADTQPRNLKSPGTAAWNAGAKLPNNYGQLINGPVPPHLTTQVRGQVVKTVFGNTNLNLRNVMIEVVPLGFDFTAL